MRIPLNTYTSDGYTNKNWELLQRILNGGLGLDNFRGELAEGTTASFKKDVYHKFGTKVIGGFVIFGNAYVSKITEEFVRISSPDASTQFKVFIISE